MKHSKYDWFLALLLIYQLAILVMPFFIALSTLSLIGLGLVNVLLMGTNYQCIAHNFIHLPFFKSNFLNNLFSVVNTLGIGVPQSMYRLHHLNHHRFNNQPEGDWSSTLKYGKNGQEENIFLYSLLGIIRTDLVMLFKLGSKNSKLPLMELITLSLFLTAAAILNWKLMLFYLLPSYMGGQFFALWENHCEHHGSNPKDRKRDSVSCYNPLYNFLWFNNGYHQEHHYSPQVHWTEIQKVKDELPEDRVIVKFCHLTNIF